MCPDDDDLPRTHAAKGQWSLSGAIQLAVNLTPETVASLIRGPAGSTVELHFLEQSKRTTSKIPGAAGAGGYMGLSRPPCPRECFFPLLFPSPADCGIGNDPGRLECSVN